MIATDLPLETERLLLRPFTDDDMEVVHAYATDDGVIRFMNWGPNSPGQTRTFLRDAARCVTERQGDLTLAVTVRESGLLAGGISLQLTSEENGEAELGYCLAREYWGKGYATEASARMLTLAFGEWDLHRVIATCRPANRASARVLEKLGMRREGLLRSHLKIRGEWVDSHLYAILENEWSAENVRRGSHDLAPGRFFLD